MSPNTSGSTDRPMARASWDCAARRPMRQSARTALLAALDDGWADENRLYREARSARMLLDGARETVADLVGVRTEEVFFGSDQRVGMSRAIRAVSHGRRRQGALIAHSPLEQLTTLDAITASGALTTRLPVDDQGTLETVTNVTDYADWRLAVVQQANAEIGTRQPLDRLHPVLAAAGVPLLVDADATLGRVLPQPHWDVLVAGSAGFGGPPGRSILAVRAAVRWQDPLGDVAGRAGGCDVPSALATAVALRDALAEQQAAQAVWRRATDRLRDVLAATVADLEIPGPRDDARLANVLTVSALYCDGEHLVRLLDAEGFSVGSGSACVARHDQPSHVLSAIGALTHGNIQIGLMETDETTLNCQVDRFIEVFPRVVGQVRELLGAGDL